MNRGARRRGRRGTLSAPNRPKSIPETTQMRGGGPKTPNNEDGSLISIRDNTARAEGAKILLGGTEEGGRIVKGTSMIKDALKGHEAIEERDTSRGRGGHCRSQEVP